MVPTGNGWRRYKKEGLKEHTLYEIKTKHGETHVARFNGKNMIPNTINPEVHFKDEEIDKIRELFQ